MILGSSMRFHHTPSVRPKEMYLRCSWFPLMIVVPLSVCPPPPLPSPFSRTTVLVPMPSLLTEEYFGGSPARPRPAAPPWTRTSCRPPKRLLGPVLCPPPPPYYMAMLVSWYGCTLVGKVAVIYSPWVNPHHGRGPWDQVTALAKRGTSYIFMSIILKKYSKNNFISFLQ